MANEVVMIRTVIRRTVSMASLFSFIYLAFTGIILYIMPQGRVAYWADWHIFGLNKDNIGQTHTTISMLFVILMILHVWLNWSSIVLYMRNRSKKFVIFTPETLTGFILACAVFFGTLYSIAPFSTVNSALADFKEDYEYTLGNPPYGHAELSTLAVLMERMDIDSAKAQKMLKARGYTYDLDKTVKEIARNNNVRPAEIYEVIKTARVKKLPVAADTSKPAIDMQKYEALKGTGMGMKTVAEAADKCGISEGEALSRLAKNGVKAKADDTLKDAAEYGNVTPMDVYIIIDTGTKP